MKVHLTFDVEVWCNGWHDLDARFPASFERYCYGRSAAGDYALPKTLEILNRHHLTGVFFVEPLFSARFGREYLDRMVGLIGDAQQDVQLHLHPEWTDEIRPPLIEDVSRKRQHLTHYSEDEQTALIGAGKRLLEAAKGGPVTAFRAGSFAANRSTLAAVQRNGIGIDSSLNRAYDYSDGSIPELRSARDRLRVDEVDVYPVTVFRDGFARLRAAQINGCAFAELRCVLERAERAGTRHFVLVSHNFEMLKPGTSLPDWFVVRRFEALCAFLAQRRDRFDVGAFDAADGALPAAAPAELRAGPWVSARRVFEQAVRRLQ